MAKIEVESVGVTCVKYKLGWLDIANGIVISRCYCHLASVLRNKTIKFHVLVLLAKQIKLLYCNISQGKSRWIMRCTGL